MSRRSTLHGFFTGTRLKVLILATGTVLAISFAMLWSSQSSSAATQGPVAAWSFDENTGETVEDLYGEADGTVEHATWARGRYGSALAFDGEESCVTVPNSETLQLGEEFTLEAWVRPDSAKEFAPVFFKEDSELDYGYVLMAGGVEGGHPSGYVVDGTWPAPEIEATAELPIHVWSHLALTFDGAHIRLYVNGALVASGAADAPLESHGSLRIGCGDNYGYWDYFEGRIDEPRIYERVLSPAEIAADVQAPLGTPQAGPVAEYSFDEGEGTTAEDLTGDGNTGAIEGAAWTTHGRYGGALEFDGSGSCLTIPDGPRFQMGEEFTLEAWVRPEGPHEFAPLFYKQDGEGGYGYALWADEVEGRPAGEVDDATYPVPQIEGKAELPAHTWSHLAFTYDGAHMRLYVDGEQVASGASDAPIESEGPLKIGCADDFGYEHHFEGRIDEPRVYERALSAGEVAADMETPIETPKSGPIAAYAFDEGEGGTVTDVTGDGHTATIEGGAEWTRGKYGGALGFLEEGDCASVADSPDLRLSEEFTLEAWVRPDGGIYEDPVVVRESGGEDVFGLGIGSSEEGHAEAFIGEGGGSQTAVGGKEIREYEWVHLAATWDGSKIRLYVDGELAATKAASTPPGTGEGGLRIGCDTPEGPFGGRIDELRVYGRTLSGAEVAADMETPLQTPKQAPVAKYSFDEDNEETATDLTGDGHTATVEGAKWTEHGRYGGAYEFDAEEGDVLKIPASPELDFDEEFTLEAWVRPSGEENKEAPLIDKQEGSGLGYFLYEGGTVSDRPVGAVEGGQEHVHADDPLPAHAWSHVALTFTGDRTYLYVNGELAANSGAEPVVTSEGELEIGGSTDTGEYFDGRIDEVQIYNRGLSAAEVGADMEAPIETPKQGPVAAWPFDEGEGTTVEDLTGDGHDGTIEGAEWARGKYGDGLKFDGEESCVTIPDGPQFQLGEQFTLEAWVRPSSNKAFAPVFFKEDSGSKYGYALWAGEADGGVPAGEVNDTTSPVPQVEAKAELTPHVWSHLAFTYDGAHMRLYIDGELVDTGAAEAPIETDGSLRIGCGVDNGFPDYFEGRIDEPRVYERALSAGEIATTRSESIYQTPPIIELSGSLMEGLKAGTSSYRLHVKASDGKGAGVSHVAISLDGKRVATKPNSCGIPPCQLETEWTFEPSEAENGEDHIVEVEAEDRVGLTNREYVELSSPDGAIPACRPDGVEPTSTPTEVKALPSGGSEEIYETADGAQVGIPRPPEGFNPILASASELEEYGVPRRPSSEPDLAAWEEAMNSFTEVAEGAGCAGIGSPESEPIQRVYSEANEHFAGYTASNGTEAEFTGASAIIKQPEHLGQCKNSHVGSWVGMGGNREGFFQGGVTRGDGRLVAFGEFITPPTFGRRDKPNQKLLGIELGDRIYASVNWNSALKRGEVWVQDLRNGRVRAFHQDELPSEPLYNGKAVSFMVEASSGPGGNPFGLPPFDQFAFSEVVAYRAGSTSPSPIGSLLPRFRSVLERRNTVLGVPTALGPGKRGFLVNWKACRP